MVISSSAPHIALNAHLLSGQASYRTAGIHGYIYNTLNHLPAAAPEMAFTVLTGHGSSVPSVGGLPVKRTMPATHRPPVRILWEQAVAPFVLGRMQPDLLHGMAFSLPVLWQGTSVVTIYDLSFIRYPKRLPASRRLYLKTITRSSVNRASRIIAISQATKHEVINLLGVEADRIDVAYPGVSPDFKTLPAKQVDIFRHKNSLPDRFILYLGTLEPRKNLNTLLRAYAALPQRRNVKLVLAGAVGWLSKPIFTLIEELGLTEDLLLPGYIAGEMLPMWYNLAEIFTYPSLYEGFGMPLVEAMACGTPVLASDTTSLPEAVGNAGRLLPPTDSDAWTEALASLLDDPAQRKKLAIEGIKHAQTFTWTRTARQTVDVYRRVLKETRKGIPGT